MNRPYGYIFTGGYGIRPYGVEGRTPPIVWEGFLLRAIDDRPYGYYAGGYGIRPYGGALAGDRMGAPLQPRDERHTVGRGLLCRFSSSRPSHIQKAYRLIIGRLFGSQDQGKTMRSTVNTGLVLVPSRDQSSMVRVP